MPIGLLIESPGRPADVLACVVRCGSAAAARGHRRLLVHLGGIRVGELGWIWDNPAERAHRIH